MPNLPAFCDTCGTAFPSGFEFENVRNLTIKNVRSGPCPKCGGMGTVSGGVFNIVGNAIEIISASEQTIQQLQNLLMILQELMSTPAPDRETVKNKIENEVPELSSVVGTLPKTRSELYAVLTLLLLAVSIMVDIRGCSEPQEAAPDIIINQCLEQVLKLEPPESTDDGDGPSKPDRLPRKPGL